ncbi:phosphatidylinositol 4,5-bisphosphate 5-phosphatase A-like isoform X2 [Artemia franciscana]|uniref:phosphatidylinositol 4,5-bisphosphate 5-phosphatase A-like isoform X2 n=1 Tax=Artemia franciscana TaxID=6661 RepID=UPI0032DA65D4
MDRISLYILTWNVAVSPPKEDLREALDLCEVDCNSTSLPDIYVTGFQEVVNKPDGIIYNALFEDEWTNAVRDVLGDYGYVKIKTNRLVGIVLSVYVRREALLRYEDIDAYVTRTGFGGLWGNKGSVSVRLSISGVSAVFITSHLAALDGFYEDRINDYHLTVNSQKFKYSKTSTIFQHDYTFWFGDFNFRLEPGTLDTQKIIDLVKHKELSTAFEHDELSKAMKTGQAFALMTEMEPHFPPTYKYRVGSNEYDLKRRPAWTDRILFRVAPWEVEGQKLSLKQHSYRALKNYTQSDHKPVVASFSVAVPHYDEKSKATAMFKIIDGWQLDRPGEAVVTISKDFPKSAWDWIGLYRENFTSLDEYLTYVWSPIEPFADSQYLISIPTDSLSIPGRFVLIYMSHAGSCAKGISDVFESFANSYPSFDRCVNHLDCNEGCCLYESTSAKFGLCLHGNNNCTTTDKSIVNENDSFIEETKNIGIDTQLITVLRHSGTRNDRAYSRKSRALIGKEVQSSLRKLIAKSRASRRFLAPTNLTENSLFTEKRLVAAQDETQKVEKLKEHQTNILSSTEVVEKVSETIFDSLKSEYTSNQGNESLGAEVDSLPVVHAENKKIINESQSQEKIPSSSQYSSTLINHRIEAGVSPEPLDIVNQFFKPIGPVMFSSFFIDPVFQQNIPLSNVMKAIYNKYVVYNDQANSNQRNKNIRNQQQSRQGKTMTTRSESQPIRKQRRIGLLGDLARMFE